MSNLALLAVALSEQRVMDADIRYCTPEVGALQRISSRVYYHDILRVLLTWRPSLLGTQRQYNSPSRR